VVENHLPGGLPLHQSVRSVIISVAVVNIILVMNVVTVYTILRDFNTCYIKAMMPFCLEESEGKVPLMYEQRYNTGTYQL
jgi:hypothetical protein